RHTISTRDWSSDVCSSDLLATVVAVVLALAAAVAWSRGHGAASPARHPVALGPLLALDPPADAQGVRPDAKVTVHTNRGRLSAEIGRAPCRDARDAEEAAR